MPYIATAASLSLIKLRAPADETRVACAGVEATIADGSSAREPLEWVLGRRTCWRIIDEVMDVVGLCLLPGYVGSSGAWRETQIKTRALATVPHCCLLNRVFCSESL